MKTILPKSIYMVFCVLSMFSLNAQTFDWVACTDGAIGAFTRKITIDHSGNIYAASMYQDSVDQDPGPAVNMAYGDGLNNVLIQKFDGAKNLLWTGNFPKLIVSGFASDDSGNVYMTGRFVGIADFDPTPGVYNLTATTVPSYYVLKLDDVGNLGWAERMGTDKMEPLDMECDGVGNIYISGRLSGYQDVDPGPGSWPVSPISASDSYLMKLDNSGAFQWFKQLGSYTYGIEQAFDVAVDPTGGVYVIGQVDETADVDPGPDTVLISGPASYEVAPYLQKFDTSGNLLWAVRTVYFMGHVSAVHVAADINGNAYVTGEYSSSMSGMDFNPGTGTFTLPVEAAQSTYIQKFDADGGFLWVKQISGTTAINNDVNITLSNGENVYVTCAFTGGVDTDTGPGAAYIFSHGMADILVVKLDSHGNTVWAGAIQGNYTEDALDIKVYADYVYLSGYYIDTIDFDPGIGVAQEIRSHVTAFLTKWSQPTSGVKEHNNALNASIYPNPTNGAFTIDMKENVSGVQVQVINANGQLVQEQNFSGNKTSLTIDGPAGLYFITVTSGDQQSVMKMVKE